VSVNRSQRRGRLRACSLLALLALTGFAAGCSRDPVDPPRLLIVGLDGADLRWVDRLHAQGRLPHLGELLDRGVSASLETVHFSSPVIWTSMATGVVPERHGIVSFLNDEKVPFSSNERLRPAFWNILSAAGHSVGVLGWWDTFPAERVDGYLVSPYMMFRGQRTGVVWSDADRYKTYPPELYAELEPYLYEAEDVSRWAMRRVYADDERTPQTPWALAHDRTYSEIALRMLAERPTETVAVYFEGIDVASHDLTSYVFGRNVNRRRAPKVSWDEVRRAHERVEAMYQHLDSLVGDLLERTGPGTDVIVVSDHGWEYDGTSHWNRNAGIFLAAGPSFRKGVRTEPLSVLDVTPLILTVLGLPVAEAFDGSVPVAALREPLRAGVRFVADYGIEPVSAQEGHPGSTAEDQQMVELLRSLGYVK
jgi:predicted AlkP superfamily phosphohydrolase/phosphomutase